MSAIPPNVVGPILQSADVQRQASRVLETERDQQNSAAQATSRSQERAAESVGEADHDMAVYSESEGTGSQGRAFQEAPSGQAPETPPGIQEDQDGQMHLDLEA